MLSPVFPSSVLPVPRLQTPLRSTFFGLPVLGVALGLLLGVGAASIAAEPEFSATELRSAFPAKGDEGTAPEFREGWDYFVEQGGGRLDGQPFVWLYDSPEGWWPEGRLQSGPAHVTPDPDHEDALIVMPGNDEVDAVVQWTAPVAGNFQIEGWFQRIQNLPDSAAEADGVEWVFRGPGGKEIQKLAARIDDTEVKRFSFKIWNMKAGETLDFVVHGIGGSTGNDTRMSARITKTPEAE